MYLVLARDPVGYKNLPCFKRFANHFLVKDVTM